MPSVRTNAETKKRKKAGDAAPLVKSLPSIHKAWFSPSTTGIRPGIRQTPAIPALGRWRQKDLEGQSHVPLHSKFETSLDYRRLYLKRTKTKLTNPKAFTSFNVLGHGAGFPLWIPCFLHWPSWCLCPDSRSLRSLTHCRPHNMLTFPEPAPLITPRAPPSLICFLCSHRDKKGSLIQTTTPTSLSSPSNPPAPVYTRNLVWLHLRTQNPTQAATNCPVPGMVCDTVTSSLQFY